MTRLVNVVNGVGARDADTQTTLAVSVHPQLCIVVVVRRIVDVGDVFGRTRCYDESVGIGQGERFGRRRFIRIGQISGHGNNVTGCRLVRRSRRIRVMRLMVSRLVAAQDGRQVFRVESRQRFQIGVSHGRRGCLRVVAAFNGATNVSDVCRRTALLHRVHKHLIRSIGHNFHPVSIFLVNTTEASGPASSNNTAKDLHSSKFELIQVNFGR